MLIYLNNMVCLCVCVSVVSVCVKVCLCMLGKQKLILSVFKAYKSVKFIRFVFYIFSISYPLLPFSSDLLFHPLPAEVFLNLITPPSTFMSNTPHLLRSLLLTSLSNDVFISVGLTQHSNLKTLSSFTDI